MKTLSTNIATQTSRSFGFSIATVALGAALLSILAGTTLAISPLNDNFVDATVITGVPFSDSVDNTTATTEPGEPQYCNFLPHSVWYAFTPTVDAVLRADMAGSSFWDNAFTVWEAAGPGLGGLNFLNCASYGGSATFAVQAGTTYYLQAGDVFTGGGILQMNLQEIPVPLNDDFANAAPITTLPFANIVDTSAASQEAGEPTPDCGVFGMTGTVWFAFTPAASGSVTAIANSPFNIAVAVYTGSSLSSLTAVSCTSAIGEPLTFHANAGTTYFFQVANFYGQSGPVQFQLGVAPAPIANASYYPPDPSTFDTVQFGDYSADPGQYGWPRFASFTWDFGDGATATEANPLHRYAADADYPVQHTVTTFDGRTASTSLLLHIQTHDVAITKLGAPKAVSAGQTRTISVAVDSKRYSENVNIFLLKSVPVGGPYDGYEAVGSLDQLVPARGTNRTTQFDFNYTFTTDDAAVGKVTFKAVAHIFGARGFFPDALPADNVAISSPTKVSR